MRGIFLYLGVVTAVLLTGARTGCADVPQTIRIGVLNDMSGPYSDNAGEGSVVAAHMAADQFIAAHPGVKVEILSGDHQNKVDVGSAIAREWIDVAHVDAIADVPNSAVGLAVSDVTRGTHAALLASSAATSDLTGKYCSPNTVQWTYDTWAVSHALSEKLVADGARSWFFIATNNALGQSMVRDATASLDKIGGKVAGTAYTPINSSDYSSILLQAATSNAQVVAFATAGGDTVSLIKQTAEFGMRQPGKSFAAMLATSNDVLAAGLPAAQGVILVLPFYAGLDDASRAWSEAFGARDHGRTPTAFQAGVYSSVRAYLDAVAAAGSTDGATVVRQLKRQRIHDDVFGDVVVRPDGRATHAMYVFRVKSPSDSKGPNDILEKIGTLAGDQAFRPVDQGGCPLLSQMR